ncbi:MAG: hypothetical protein A2V88_06865 [Elusimicrobia bacterium RBG_16_66_12]|nr:MAG: hypothetical protein A2V88_06865 [Elusimicrobia bacterium RBG_16_66_12]
MAAWRIDFAKFSKEESFSGNGAAIGGGRWNHPETRMIYAADTLALAALEKFIHLGDEGRALRLVCYRIDIPANIRIEELKPREMPRDWKVVPAPRSTMDIGTRWVRNARSSILKLPSVAIETESNYLLNPLHPDFKRLAISSAEPFEFDARMWKNRT